jgi:hypothetical protein
MPKKQPPPLHISLQKIQRERVNVAKRTKERTALLYSQANTKESQNYHCCLNTFALFLCVTIDHEPSVSVFSVAIHKDEYKGYIIIINIPLSQLPI